MPSMDTILNSRIFNNLLVLFILGWIFLSAYSKMKDKIDPIIDSIKGWFGNKEGK